MTKINIKEIYIVDVLKAEVKMISVKYEDALTWITPYGDIVKPKVWVEFDNQIDAYAYLEKIMGEMKWRDYPVDEKFKHRCDDSLFVIDMEKMQANCIVCWKECKWEK